MTVIKNGDGTASIKVNYVPVVPNSDKKTKKDLLFEIRNNIFELVEDFFDGESCKFVLNVNIKQKRFEMVKEEYIKTVIE